jgi:hypothetical protein
MLIPKPEEGLVIGYGFLWNHERSAGIESGKDRPCLAISIVPQENSERNVILLPITHSEPQQRGTSIEIPKYVNVALGFGKDDRSWIRLNQANIIRWPPLDLAQATGKPDGTASYGKIPDAFLYTVKTAYEKMVAAKQVVRIERTDDVGNQRSFRHGSPQAS